MTVREVLCETAELLGEEDLKTAIKNSNENSDAEIKRKTEILLACFNTVQSEISINYQMPEKEIDVNGKQIDISNISPLPIKIISVLDEFGEKLDFSYKNNCIYTDYTAKKLIYGYVPQEKGIDDDFEFSGKLISKRAFKYGISAEYCLIEVRYEESVNWESRYRQALEVKKDYSKIRLKAGTRWGL